MYAVAPTVRDSDRAFLAATQRLTDAAPIEIRLFGGLSLNKFGKPVAWRGGARTEGLLLTLAVEQSRGVCRERLLTQLWPESDPSLASQAFHSLLYSLHRLLGDAIDGAMPVVRSGEMYRINVEAGISVDVIAFERRAREGDRQWQLGSWLDAATAYRIATDLYRGDLRASEDDSVVFDRERLRASYLVMLARLADMARREQDYSSAIEYASLVLKHDGGREDAHRTLMCCYALLGQRAQAMRQYLLCERILREVFDAVPETATREFYDRLRLRPGGALEKD
jgi:DNA-binding SARP family transcriptional activator